MVCVLTNHLTFCFGLWGHRPRERGDVVRLIHVFNIFITVINVSMIRAVGSVNIVTVDFNPLLVPPAKAMSAVGTEHICDKANNMCRAYGSHFSSYFLINGLKSVVIKLFEPTALKSLS
jgi:hypothetical protein